MSVFVIANKNTEVLETTVFSSNGGDTVALFTDLKNATQYIEDAGWSDQSVVATLEHVPFIEWLVQCHNNDVRLIATNPSRSEQEAGMKINTLAIIDQLKHAAEHIWDVANNEF